MSHTFPSPQPDFGKRGLRRGGLYERDECRDDRKITAVLLKEQCREKPTFTLPHITANLYDVFLSVKHKKQNIHIHFLYNESGSCQALRRIITVAQMMCAIFHTE